MKMEECDVIIKHEGVLSKVWVVALWHVDCVG